MRVRLLREGAQAPRYATAGAAGADLCACIDSGSGGIHLMPGERMIIDTGVAIELPPGHVGLVRGRSGRFHREGLQVITGVIDEDYRGPVGVMVLNVSSSPAWIRHGDRIAQLVILPVVRVTFDVADSLSETERGAGGFGSTGDRDSEVTSTLGACRFCEEGSPPDERGWHREQVGSDLPSYMACPLRRPR